jgi:hypothetical protein
VACGVVVVVLYNIIVWVVFTCYISLSRSPDISSSMIAEQPAAIACSPAPVTASAYARSSRARCGHPAATAHRVLSVAPLE